MAAPPPRRHWPAPAKLNLFLHVTARRADGYHELQTVFRFLDYADELEIVVTQDGTVTRSNDVAAVPPAADLCLRAAQLLKRRTGSRLGARIGLGKRIPVGAGLGGGSSDAATTLIALNHLWGLELSRAELMELGRELGADVPVFVFGHAAWGEGIGERLTAIELPPSWYVVLVPPVSVATGQVFASAKLTRQSRPITIRDFREGRCHNDLEPVVRDMYPQVDEALCWLRQYGDARMTGSGAAVFAAVEDREPGLQILARRPRGYVGVVARGIDVHPLAELRQ